MHVKQKNMAGHLKVLCDAGRYERPWNMGVAGVVQVPGVMQQNRTELVIEIRRKPGVCHPLYRQPDLKS